MSHTDSNLHVAPKTGARRTTVALLAAAITAAAASIAFAAPAAPESDGAAPPHAREHGRWHGPREIDLATARQRATTEFDRVDSNDDNRISEAELAAAGPMALGGPRGFGRHGGGHHGPRHHGPGAQGMGRHGPDGEGPPNRAEALQDLFTRLDTNSDGKLGADEFAKLPEARRAARVAHAFQRMDTDKNGSLARNEFPPMLARLEAWDTNKDGKVTRDEFPARGAHRAPPRS